MHKNNGSTMNAGNLTDAIRKYDYCANHVLLKGSTEYEKAFESALFFYKKLTDLEKNQISLVKLNFKQRRVFECICIEFKNTDTSRAIHFMFYPRKTVVHVYSVSEFGYDFIYDDQYILN